MSATDYAAEELALWEKALKEQRHAERQLSAAKSTRKLHIHWKLLRHVEALRTRADLLLAHAVEVKRAFSSAQDTAPSWIGYSSRH